MASAFDDKGAIKFIAFDGERPEQWRLVKSKLQAVLDSKNYLRFLLSDGGRPEQPGEEQDKYDDTNSKIFSCLLIAMSGTPMDIVNEYEEARVGINSARDGKAAWKALKDKYEASGRVKKQDLLHEMEGTIITAKEDPDKCFRRLVNLKSELKALGVDVPDDVTMSRLQYNMPSNYKQLMVVLDCQKTLTYEEFKQ